ncbi:MAG: universal stress protein [Vicinamibacteria bacterium]
MPFLNLKHILCPTDFSEPSTRALRHAAALAQKTGATLKVVHVVDHGHLRVEEAYGLEPWLMTPALKNVIDEQMRAFLAPLRETRVDHLTEIREGDPCRELLKASVEWSADVVVVATKGKGMWEDLIVGSVAAKLIRRLDCSVITVSNEGARTWEAPGLIARVLCATDSSASSSIALRAGLALARRFQAESIILHVIEGPEADASEVHYTREQEISSPERIHYRETSGRAYAEILKVAAAESADLIVIGDRGHSRLVHFFTGSNAERIVAAATCPVLIVRPPVDATVEEHEIATHALALVKRGPATTPA